MLGLASKERYVQRVKLEEEYPIENELSDRYLDKNVSVPLTHVRKRCYSRSTC